MWGFEGFGDRRLPMRNKVLILGLLLGMGVAVVVDQRQRFETPVMRWLYPGFLESLPLVTGLRLSKAGDGVDLVLDNGVWVVAQRFNYPVNDKQLFQLLDQLGKARLIEKKTTLSKHHAALGLVEDSSDSASVLMFHGDNLLKPVVIGQQASTRQGTFVRFQSDDQVWLMDQALEVSGAAADWLAPNLLTINNPIIESIELSNPGEANYRVVRDERDNWVLAATPEGRALRYETVLTPLATTVGQLRLIDIALHDPARWVGAGAAVYHLTSSHRLILKTVAADKSHWLRIVVEADEVGHSEPLDKTPQSQAVEPLRSPALDQVLGPSREALARFDFRIAKRNFDDLNRPLESFLKPQELEENDG